MIAEALCRSPQSLSGANLSTRESSRHRSAEPRSFVLDTDLEEAVEEMAYIKRIHLAT
jgi:hypothetical protein